MMTHEKHIEYYPVIEFDFVTLELKLCLVISKKYLIENVLQVAVNGTKCKKHAFE